jgi:hypothetical protein
MSKSMLVMKLNGETVELAVAPIMLVDVYVCEFGLTARRACGKNVVLVQYCWMGKQLLPV